MFWPLVTAVADQTVMSKLARRGRMRIDTRRERHQWAAFGGVVALVAVVWASYVATGLPAAVEWLVTIGGTVLGGLGMGYHHAVRNRKAETKARALAGSRRRGILMWGAFWGSFPHAMVGVANPPSDPAGSLVSIVPGWVLVGAWFATFVAIVVVAIRTGRGEGESLREAVTEDSP